MAEKNLDFLKLRLDTYDKRLEDETDESKRSSFKSKIAEIEQQINEVKQQQMNENDLNYLKELEKFLESQLNNDYELNNTIRKYDSKKTLEQTNDRPIEQADKVIKQEKEIKGNEQIKNQIDETLVEKGKDIDGKKNVCETKYTKLNEELVENEDEIFKTDLDVQRGQKDVEITNSRIEDYGNLEKRLQDTIDTRTSDSKKKEKEALLLQTEINVNF